MTNKTDGPGPKRPHATIEGKATEVKADPVSPPPGSAASSASTTSSTPSADQRAAAGRVAGAAASVAADIKAPTKPDDAKKPAAAAASTSSAASSAKPNTPMPAPRSSGSAFGRMLSSGVSAVVGGALVLLAAPYVPALQSRLGAPGTSQPSPEIVQRLAALEQVAKKASQPIISDEIAKRLATLEQGVDKLTTIAPAIHGLGEGQIRLDAETKELKEQLARRTGSGSEAERLSRLEERLSVLSAAALADPKGAGPIPQLAQITGRIADLETALTNRLAAARRDMITEIDNRLAATSEAAEAAKSGAQRLDREVTGLKSDSTRTIQRVDQLKTSSDQLAETARAAQDEIATLKTALDTARRDIANRFGEAAKPADVAAAVAPATARLAKLESSVDNVLKAETDRRTTAERIVLSLELGNLKRAMDRGGSYAAELAEVRKVAGNRIDLSVLQRYQADGIPTIAELSRQFRPLASAIIEADAEQHDASVVDRLMSGARTIVRVRKLTPDAGDTSTEANVARIEGALRDGRLGDALTTAKALPAKAITPATRDWLDKVSARQAVETAMTTIDQQLKSSLGATPAATPAATKDGKQ